MVNNIKNNTTSEIFAKESLNVLKQTKNAERIKYKKCTPGQKELLNLFNNLSDTILTDKTLKSKSQKDKTLMSSKDEKDNYLILLMLLIIFWMNTLKLWASDFNWGETLKKY